MSATSTVKDDSTMPSAPEAEMGVLAFALAPEEQKEIVNAMSLLKPSDFYSVSNRRIFEACIELQKREEEINIVTICTQLREWQLLESVGGIAYIAHLGDGMCFRGTMDSFIQKILDASLRRSIITQSNQVLAMALDSSIPIDDVALQSKKTFELAQHRFKQEPIITAGELAFNRLRELEEFGRSGKQLLGLTSGYKSIDRKTSGWQPADLVIVAARPSQGKSSLALNFSENALASDSNVAFFSLEMPTKALVDRLLCSMAKVDLWRYRRFAINRDEANRLMQAHADLEDFAGKLFIEDKMRTVSAIRARCNALNDKFPLGLILVDYAQLAQSETRKDSRNHEVGDIINGLKAIAVDFNVPVIALSQMSRRVEMRLDRRPDLSDLRESGEIEQTADTVIFIHADKEDQQTQQDNSYILPVTLIIAKQRNGPIGDLPFMFHKQYTRFEEAN